ncbi:suppressor of fused domain protein [Corynebacterium sphenisci]|nr:suppressor of fused domain protein [Corynebacterium sphenisci]
MSPILDAVRRRLCGYFEESDPASATLTFLGAGALTILRFGPDTAGVVTYATVGCSAEPMSDPADFAPDPVAGPRAELLLPVHGGLDAVTRPLAMLAAAPTVEGLVLRPGALLDFTAPLWPEARFTGFVLLDAEVPEVDPAHLPGAPAGAEPVRFLQAVPATANELALARAKGAAALVEAWRAQGADPGDPHRAPAV